MQLSKLERESNRLVRPLVHASNRYNNRAYHAARKLGFVLPNRVLVALRKAVRP